MRESSSLLVQGEKICFYLRKIRLIISGITLVFSSFSRQHVHVHVLSPQDPFGDHLKGMMQKIHDFIDLPDDITLRECGTQEYEADVVILERQGEGGAGRGGAALPGGGGGETETGAERRRSRL